MKKYLFSVAFVAALGLNAHADEVDSSWTGEGSLSAGETSGNTDTRDIGLGLKLAKQSGLWVFGGEASADYGEIDGVESKNRIFAGLNVDRQINDRLFGFGKITHERDEFTGFDSRSFVGAGLGYHVLTGDATTWTVRGGPGLKYDEVKPIIVAGQPTIPAETLSSFSVFAGSEFAHAFNDSVSLSNSTGVVYAEESTQISNTIAVTSKFSNALSGRASYEIRHDTNPPIGFEETDTATRLSLVYGF